MNSKEKSFYQREVHIKALGFNSKATERLLEYALLLWETNQDLNLFSRQTTWEDLLDNHLIDCLLALPHLPTDKKRIADFGSGGGLPGVVFALHLPETEFLLFEKSPKKRVFLETCRMKLSKNLHILGEIPQSFSGVDLVTSRGFKPIDGTLEVSRSYALSQGKYFLLKGRAEKIQEEIVSAKKKFKGISFDILPLKSPVLEVERHLLIGGVKPAS